MIRETNKSIRIYVRVDPAQFDLIESIRQKYYPGITISELVRLTLLHSFQDKKLVSRLSREQKDHLKRILYKREIRRSRDDAFMRFLPLNVMRRITKLIEKSILFNDGIPMLEISQEIENMNKCYENIPEHIQNSIRPQIEKLRLLTTKEKIKDYINNRTIPFLSPTHHRITYNPKDGGTK